ncbi:uncharacterized protein LOC131619031 [Vicia villosa]|uniref:uncharacterized protein LOC131619031 n=1 Tax=Vicia villosa TaxID=3911 RepID=UPI00273B4983|nr:uncharacterized protein LOC131619031 [Vicia villosa]
MWIHLNNRKKVANGPWMLIGVFNNIIHLSEQKGDNFSLYKAVVLLNVIDKCNLVKVDMVDGKLESDRPCVSNIMVYHKLDNALVDVAWCMALHDAHVELFCKFHYDHNLILIRCGIPLQDHGSRSFRFEHDSTLFNKETVGNIIKQKHDIEKRLGGIQRSLKIIDLARLVYLQQELQR